MKKFGVFSAFSISITVVAVILIFSGVGLAASAHCDFNGDGFDDIAIGVVNERFLGTECSDSPCPCGECGAGGVNVIYGKANGLAATNNQFWHKDSPNVLGEGSEGEEFGTALACGDFNRDSRDDLAIGAPFTSVNGVHWAGTVTVLYGTASGLTATGNQLWSEDSPGVLGVAENSELFGGSLAAGDFNGDGRADLAVGSRWPAAGEVHILFGSSGGLSSNGDQLWTRQSTAVGVASSDDSFGQSLVAADFGKDTASNCYDDLAISAPGTSNGTGAVYVLYGSATGLSASGSQFWSQNTLGIVGYSGDFFGQSLAAGTFRGSNSICGKRKIADLIVGAPEKLITVRSGAVFVIYGTNAGLSATGNQMWHQDSSGIAEKAEASDRFGQSMAAGHTTSGHDYLAISAAYEDVSISTGTFPDAGVVHILYTHAATGRLTASGSKLYHQNAYGIHDSVELSETFGLSLATGDFNLSGRDDLVIGVPREGLNAQSSVGAVHVLYGGDTTKMQFFHQNSADIKNIAEDGDLFGWALSR
jgi:hypothetical protein